MEGNDENHKADQVAGLLNLKDRELPVEEGGEKQRPDITDEDMSEKSNEQLENGAEDVPVGTQNDSESQEGKNEDKYASKVKKKLYV